MEEETARREDQRRFLEFFSQTSLTLSLLISSLLPKLSHHVEIKVGNKLTYEKGLNSALDAVKYLDMRRETQG